MKSNDTQNFTADKQSRKNAFGKIIPLALVALLLAGAIISIANDMYAFVKQKHSATIFIEAESSVYKTAQLLEDNGIINNPAAFTLYVTSKDARDKILSFSGEIYLSASMSYREILRSFAKSE